LIQVISECFSTTGKPVLVGHSFGGFLSTALSHERPELIQSVTLVAPAGILPTHGSRGALWAIFFRWIITCEPLQCCSCFFWWLASHLFMCLSADEEALTANLAWFQILASPHRSPVQLHFTELHLYAGSWKRPLLLEFLSLRVPVALIYGELDTIMPPHQGEFFANMAGAANRNPNSSCIEF
jgi:pimeloyl-ACP methyl ester carboxylesterase